MRNWSHRRVSLLLTGVLIALVAFELSGFISHFTSNVGLLLLSRSLVQQDILRSSNHNDPNLASAERWLRFATELNIVNRDAWRGLGFTLAAQGQQDEAVAAWQSAGAMGQDLIERGEVARLAGRYDEAMIWYDRAARVSSDLQSSILYLRFLVQQARTATSVAFENLQQAVGIDKGWLSPEMRFRAWHAWGSWLVEQARYAEAENALATAILILPDDSLLQPILSETYRFLGLAQWSQHKLDEAVRSLRTAVQLDSQNVWAHIHYGKVLYLEDASRAPETKREFEAALTLNTGNVEVWKNLIKFWHMVKEAKNAQELCMQSQGAGIAAALVKECLF